MTCLSIEKRKNSSLAKKKSFIGSAAGVDPIKEILSQKRQN